MVEGDKFIFKLGQFTVMHIVAIIDATCGFGAGPVSGGA